jgi:hypothetical protein
MFIKPEKLEGSIIKDKIGSFYADIDIKKRSSFNYY